VKKAPSLGRSDPSARPWAEHFLCEDAELSNGEKAEDEFRLKEKEADGKKYRLGNP
jgi:hypothetical protein